MDPLSQLRQDAMQRAQGGAGTLTNRPDSGMGWLEGAGRSALWSMGPGLVGVRPGPELEKWQAQNPVSSFAAGAVGMIVPYAGWARATQSATALGRGMQAAMNRVAPASAMRTAPVRTAAAREIVRFAPLEAGRIASAPVLGPMFEASTDGTYMGVGDVAVSAGTDLVLGGAIGGVFGALSAYGRKVKNRRNMRPGADLQNSLQGQWRQIDEQIAAGKVAPENIERVNATKNRMAREIFEEKAPDGRFFREDYLENVYGDLFRTKAKTRYRVKEIGDRALFRSDAINATLRNLPDGWQARVKYPRILQTRLTGDAAKNEKNFRATNDLLGRLGNGGGGTRWEYLKDENTFLVSRQLTDTDHLVFKTDSPDFWMPENAGWKDMLEEGSRATFGRQVLEEITDETGSQLLDYGVRLKKELPFVDWRGLEGTSKPGRVVETAKELLAKSGFKPYEGTGEALRRAGLFVRRYMAPAQLQTTDNPVANMIRVGVKEIKEHGEHLVQRSILGAPKQQTGSMRMSAFRGPIWDDNGSIAANAKKLAESPQEWDAFLKTMLSGDTVAQGVARHGLTERGVQLVRQLEAADQELVNSIIAVQRRAGVAEADIFVPRTGHRMLSRSWEGSWRVPVYNQEGNMVYMAGGNNKSAADSIADEVIRQNPGWRRGDARTSNEMTDIDYLRQLVDQDVDFKQAMRTHADIHVPRTEAGRPSFMEQRKGVDGFKKEYDSDDFIRAILTHNRRFRMYEAETASQILYRPQLQKLETDDPEAFRTLMERLDKMYGKEGNITRAINDAFDTVLSPLLGNNSASRITGEVNKLIYRYALGFMNTGYAVATLATFIQTTFPMMQLVNNLAMKAPERLAKYTTYQPVMSQNGARMLGNIDTLKIAGQGWKELGDPDAALRANLFRAAEEGVTDPRFLDEWVGQNAINKQRFLGVLQEKDSWVKFLRMGADIMPAMTERGARGHTFAMGHVFYRDVMGVRDPETLFRLAKEFTEKTQYMYSAGDRAQIFNGPIGGLFGLFKNWMSHYTGWMIAYAGEGARYGNWKPFLWQMAGTASVGGLGALPFIGTADDLSRFFSNDGLLLTMYEMQGGSDPDGINFADALYYGMPGLLGFSIQGTVSAPLADPGEDVVRMFSLAQWNQAQKIGRAIPAIGNAVSTYGLTGLHRDQEAIRAVINATMPKTLARGANMMASPDVRSAATGNPLVRGLSPSQRLMYSLSLNPTEVEAQFEISRGLWRDKDKLRGQIRYFGQQVSNAEQNGDWAEVRRLYMLAMARGLPMDSIQRSAQTRNRRASESLIESQFDAQVQYRMQQLGML